VGYGRDASLWRNAFDARIAVHLLVEGVDAFKTEMAGECEMITIGKGERRVLQPKIEGIEQRIAVFKCDGVDVEDVAERRRYLRSRYVPGVLQNIDRFENNCSRAACGEIARTQLNHQLGASSRKCRVLLQQVVDEDVRVQKSGGHSLTSKE